MKITLSSGTGKWNFYAAAEAADQAGVLDRFFTGVYYKNDFKSNFFKKLLPSNLQKTRTASINSGHVCTFYSPELKHALYGKLQRYINLDMREADIKRHLVYDALVASSLNRMNSDIFHVRTGFGNRSIRAAQKNGMVTITDFGGAHPRYLLRELGNELARVGLSCPDSRLYQLFQNEFDMADHIFVNSDFVRRTFEIDDPNNLHKIKVFYRGFDPGRFTFDKAKKLSRLEQKRPFRLVTLARIELNKGVHTLLEAWKQLALPDAELVIIGHPGPQEEYQFIMSRYTDCFTHVDYVSNHNLSDYYEAFDAWALCSITEGSSMSVYEAMACGLPCIVSENTGSVVRHGTDGYVFPVRDVESLKQCISELYENRQRCFEMGCSAHDYITAHYTWDNYKEKLVGEYEKIVGAVCAG